MASSTTYLDLILPLGSKYWNWDTWVENMKKLDDAYLNIHHDIELRLTANNVGLNPAIMQIHSSNAQGAVDELSHKGSSIFFIDVTEDMTLTVPSYAYAHFVLTFGNSVPTVTFVKSIPDSHNDIEWINGEPTFEANSTYELSFLHLSCLWTKRD